MTHSQPTAPSPAAGTTTEQTRLGGTGRKLTLVDVVAQSVGFMGPVFSIAFLVPLVMGIISATGNGAGIAAPLSIAHRRRGHPRRRVDRGGVREAHPGGRRPLRLRHRRSRPADGRRGRLPLLRRRHRPRRRPARAHRRHHPRHPLQRVRLHRHPDHRVGDHPAGLHRRGHVLRRRALDPVPARPGAAVRGHGPHLLRLRDHQGRQRTTLSPARSTRATRPAAGRASPSAWSTACCCSPASRQRRTSARRPSTPSATSRARSSRRSSSSPPSTSSCAYAQVAGYGFDLQAMGKNASAPLFGLGAPTAAGGYGSTGVAPPARARRRPRHARGAHRHLGRVVARHLRDEPRPPVPERPGQGVAARHPAQRQRRGPRVLRDLDRAHPAVHRACSRSRASRTTSRCSTSARRSAVWRSR